MSVSDLSASTQNYLKAVWTLQEWSDEPVTPSSLAAKAGVTLSSASDAVRRLSDQGLLHHERYGAMSLTELGRMHALSMVRRHRLIETFLVEVLGYQWDEVHDEAETLEHAVSDVMVDRIDAFLGRPERDPHGDPIPNEHGVVTPVDAVPLSALSADQWAVVARISDEDPQLLQFFATRGIHIGVRLQVREGEPYSESLEVLVEGAEEPVILGGQAAEAVWLDAESVLENSSH